MLRSYQALLKKVKKKNVILSVQLPSVGSFVAMVPHCGKANHNCDFFVDRAIGVYYSEAHTKTYRCSAHKEAVMLEMLRKSGRTKSVAVVVIVAMLLGGGMLFARGEAEVDETPVARVASNVQIPYRIFYEGEEIRGYEYEVYTEALNRAGYEVEVIDLDFAGIIPGLQAEQWDVAASNIFITHERAQSMDYSEPYFESFDVIMIRNDDDSINALEDLEGKVVGTEVGTTQAAYADELEGRYGPFEIRGFDDVETQILDLEIGRIDALTLGHPTAVEYIEDTGMFEILGHSEDNFMIGAFFRQDDPLRDEFTQALQEMKREGVTGELYEKYFGEPAPEGSAMIRVFDEPYVPDPPEDD